MKQSLRNWGWVPLVAAVIVALDQWTKHWIEVNLPLGSQWAPIPALEPWLRIVHLTNTGAAFGLMQGQGSLFVMIGLVVIVAGLVYVRYLPADNWAVRVCLSLQLGGALGNMIDRIRLGHVTDFLLLSLPLRGRLLEWPAFNVADSSIVVGVLILAFLLLRGEGEHPQPAPAAPEPPQQSTEKG